MKIGFTMKELFMSGAHFGHIREKYNPKMRPFVFALREGIHFIDLEKTVIRLSKVLDYMADQKKQGKNILFVCTKDNINDIVKRTAIEVNMPYITYRWPGGFLTNFETLRKQIKKLKDLEAKTKSEEWEKMSKKEKLKVNKEIDKLNRVFEGIKDLTKIPDNIFIIDTVKEKTALKEAKKKKIPIIALVDTNSDPTEIAYPIPCNDDAVKAVELILEEVKKALQ